MVRSRHVHVKNKKRMNLPTDFVKQYPTNELDLEYFHVNITTFLKVEKQENKIQKVKQI